MPNFFKFAILLLALAVSGCAVKRFISTVTEEPKVPIKVLDVYWNPVPPGVFKITKYARGYQPVIATGDRMEGEKSTREIYGVFQKGFQTQFRQAALAKGIPEVSVVMVSQAHLPSPIAGRHQLFVNVASLEFGCNGPTCVPSVKLEGMLRNPTSSASAWTFNTIVAPQTAYTKIDAAIFEAFATALLSDLESKGLLSR